MTTTTELTKKWEGTLRMLAQAIADDNAADIRWITETLDTRDLVEGIQAAATIMAATLENRKPAPPKPDRLPNMLDHLATNVATTTRISTRDMRGTTRRREAVTARRIFATTARLLGYSCTQIGDYLNRDHTTVTHHWAVIIERPNELAAARRIAGIYGWRSGRTAA